MVAPKAWGVDFDFLFGGGEKAPDFEEVEGYAVVTICGPMTKSAGYWGDSYDEIGERVRAAFDSDAEAVCLRIDSPGGDLAGCFELAHDLRALATSTGKRLVAFTDGECCSGAMAIASAADERVATPQAFLGSIGVWAALIDVTQQDAMFGAKVVIASSGEHKADWNPHVPMTEDSFKRLQDQVMAQAELFFALVSENLGRSVDELRALKGAAPFGQAALSAGLCDRLVPSWSAFLSGETDMPPNRSKTSKYDEAMGLLHAQAEEDSDEGKKAKKLLKAAEGGDESEDEKKKKADEAAAKKVEEDKEKEKAQATITTLAATVQKLEADAAERDKREAAEKDKVARAAIFAKRPDLNEAVRAALETMPTEALAKAVEAMPRVSAAPGSSAAATVPVVSGGERQPDTARPMTAESQAIFDRTDPFKRSQSSAKASFQGTDFTMPSRIVSASEAAARAAEIAKENGWT